MIKKKRKKPAPKQWQRKREHAVQFYLSDEEHAQLKRQCAARRCNASEFFRSKLQPPKPPKAAPAPAPEIESDPRQLTVMQHIEEATA
jgi:hypothetical protein